MGGREAISGGRVSVLGGGGSFLGEDVRFGGRSHFWRERVEKKEASHQNGLQSVTIAGQHLTAEPP